MDRKEILEKLTPIVRNALKNESLVVTEDISSKNTEQWDSLAQMLLASESEKAFSIKFKMRDINQFTTVGELVTIIETKLGYSQK